MEEWELKNLRDKIKVALDRTLCRATAYQDVLDWMDELGGKDEEAHDSRYARGKEE